MKGKIVKLNTQNNPNDLVIGDLSPALLNARPARGFNKVHGVKACLLAEATLPVDAEEVAVQRSAIAQMVNGLISPDATPIKIVRHKGGKASVSPYAPGGGSGRATRGRLF